MGEEKINEIKVGDAKIGDAVYIKTKNKEEQEFLGIVRVIDDKHIGLHAKKFKKYTFYNKIFCKSETEYINKEEIQKIKLINIKEGE